MKEYVEHRGRPKESFVEDLPKQFTRIYKDDDGVVSTWKYDLIKFPNGPIEVTNEYPKGWKSISDQVAKEQKDLPITKQKFFNPVNGKYVGYGRAKSLGLI